MVVSSLVSDFNSIKVRLKQGGWPSLVALPPFQFHKGTIKTRLHICAPLVPSYFNSIKVRLKQNYE